MKTNRKSKLLALFLSVCQMVTFFVFNASAFSSNGTEFNCGDTWVLEENVSAVNTGKSIDGVTAGIIVKVPEVNFYAGEYKAIAINAVSDNRDLNRVKVYLDGVQTDNLLAGIDFKTVGDDKTARYSAWGALEKSVSGVHDLYIYVAAGSFNLIGFKLGSETELEVSGTVIGQPEVDDTVSSTPVTDGTESSPPVIDGVVDESYETVLEMKDGSVYDLNGDTDKAVIKKYVTDEYVYLAVQYTKPDGPVGTTSAHNQIEIAIDPDPSNNGTSTDCRALSGDASRNEIYSYFKLSESVVDFSGGKDHGAQKACKVTTDAGASIYTVEYRFNRPDSADENFLLGCSVLVNASKRYATHASFDDGTTDCNWRARYIPGMYSVPYTMGETPSDVPQEPIVNAVLDPFYLEGDTDKNIYVKAGDNKYGYEVKTYMAADSADLYYFMVLTGQRHENVSNPKAEINFDPDPSNSEETGDNTKVGVGDSNDKDFRIYWNPVSGGSNYGFNANKGTKYAERTTYLENNMVEYAIEI